jgi:glutamate/tyrosine decarboxylase-like PLP-dependent enzyme
MTLVWEPSGERDAASFRPMSDQRRELAGAALDLVAGWEARFGPVPDHPALAPDPARLAAAWDEYGARMQANFPFFHPRFAGQMLKPPHPVAIAAYLAAMCVNPNNHALDGGPVTSELEKEAVAEHAAMFGLPADTLGHLTASGTIANLEALWVARESHPGKVVLYGADAHYTHERMCGVLGIRGEAVPTDPRTGAMDPHALDARCAAGDVGTVVLTTGTTGQGVLDPVDQAAALRERHGVRVHADAAYGGYFALLADQEPALAPMRAIADCDSVVVDPHKHGLQPYGCGMVLFRDPAVGRFYKHDSPYTYFTSGALHLGEISLECSRAGAAAAALWMTIRALPLRAAEGFGPVLRACLAAARGLADRIDAGTALTLHARPVLDIVTYFPARESMSEVDAASRAALEAGMADAADPVFLSTLRIGREAFATAHPGVHADADAAAVLRSVLMKPEHELTLDWLHDRVAALA